jgi:hypothetical protein
MPTIIATAVASAFTAAGTATGIAALTATGAFIGSYGAAILTVGSLVIQTTMAKRQAESQASDAAAQAREAYNASLQDRTTVIRSPVVPRNIVLGRDRTSGPLAAWFTFGNVGQNHTFAVVLAGHECDAVEQIYFNDDLVTISDSQVVAPAKYLSASGGVLFGVEVHLGGPGQVASPALMAAAAEAGVPSAWDATRVGTGICYLVINMVADYNALGQIGVPNVSAVVRGVKAYDPRTGVTAWTQNPAILARWFLVESIYSPPTLSAEINTTELNASANICEEGVYFSPSQYEGRYTANGALSSAASPLVNLNHILQAMDGDAVWIAGAWQVMAGYYRPPALTLDESALSDAAITIQPYAPRASLFNAVSGTFIGPAFNYEATSYPLVQVAQYLADDNGEELVSDVNFVLVNDSRRCQMIGWQRLTRARQQLTIQLGTNLKGYDTAPLQNITLNLAEFGYTSKVFSVRRRQFIGNQLQYTLQETGPAVWAWDYTLAGTAVDLPNTSLPNPATLAAPGAPAVVQELYQTTGSAGVRVKSIVTWSEVSDQYASGYLLEYKAAGSTDWTRRPRVADATDTVVDLLPGTYNFRVRAENSIGMRSGYSATTTKELQGLTAAPADVSNFTVTKVGGVAYGNWALTTDLDVRIGGRVVVRFCPLSSGVTWNDGFILEEFAGDAVTGVLPLITGTYMAKFVDSTGTYSAAAASFVATEGLVTGFTTVATSTQAPTFPGSKTSLAVISSNLVLDSAALWDSYPGNIDTWPEVDTLGQLASSGTYLFDTYTDLTTVATRRLEADVRVASSDTGDLWDSRTALIDDWDDIDGGTINDCDVTLYVSTTDTDPAGAPVWSAWAPFFVCDVTCRAVKFKLDVTSGNPTHQIAVSTLTVHVKT